MIVIAINRIYHHIFSLLSLFHVYRFTPRWLKKTYRIFDIRERQDVPRLPCSAPFTPRPRRHCRRPRPYYRPSPPVVAHFSALSCRHVDRRRRDIKTIHHAMVPHHVWWKQNGRRLWQAQGWLAGMVSHPGHILQRNGHLRLPGGSLVTKVALPAHARLLPP